MGNGQAALKKGKAPSSVQYRYKIYYMCLITDYSESQFTIIEYSQICEGSLIIYIIICVCDGL